MRLIPKSVFLYVNRAIISRCLSKALHQEQVSHNLTPETLTSRLVLYLSKDEEQRPPKNATQMLDKLKRNWNILSRMSMTEMVNLSESLPEFAYKNELSKLFKELDVEYYLRLPELSKPHIFKILNGFVKAIPNRIVELRFYREAVKRLYESVDTLSRKDLVQLIFYVGLAKKSPQTQSMLRHCMRIMPNGLVDELTGEELCIICNATFKSSTKITNPVLLDKIRDYINTDLSVMRDCEFLVMLVKTLRHNRCQTDDLLQTITRALFFNKTYPLYTFPVFCHIMALFADHFHYDEQLFKLFVSTCLSELKDSEYVRSKRHPRDKVRGKDITRFLWVLGMFSELKLIDQSDIKDIIIPKVMERIEGGEFDKDFESLIDMTLYIWMLNCRSCALVPYVLNKTKTQRPATNSSSNLRLNLLLYAVHLEDPDLLKRLRLRPKLIQSSEFSRYQLRNRPAVEKLLNKFRQIKNIEVNRFELTQEIPHLNIIGITGYRNDRKAVYIEILDDYTRLKNVDEDIPVGLMALKLRLLDRFEEAVLAISTKETSEMTETELTDFLRSEIRLIC